MIKFQAYLDVDETLYPFRENFAKVLREFNPKLPKNFEELYLKSRYL